jgi:hypothetical protein
MTRRPPLAHRPDRRRWAAAVAVAIVLVGVWLAASGDAQAPDPDLSANAALTARPPSGPTANALVTIAANAPTAPVPRSYLGLSTEYWALPLYGRRMGLLERALALVRVPGGGPLVIRIGGNSADHTFWDMRPALTPAWAFSLTPHWLGEARTLVCRLGVRLILDLNLITDTPAQAARWARAAESRLPRRSIIGFEIGNEPDIYNHTYWQAATAGRSWTGRRLPTAVTAAAYVRDFRVYARVLRAVAPHVPLAGPALARPEVHTAWIARLIDGDRSLLGVVSVHRYPYAACVGRRAPGFPTIARLLSPRATTGMARSLLPAARLAHAAGLPLRLTELNSVTCGGRPGVSNTFATALWAPDALFSLVRAGVNAVNLHVRADTVNSPFAITARGLRARPLLYGLALFARMLGPDARLVRPVTHPGRGTDLSVWAVRVGPARPGVLRVLLIDKGVRSLRVSLRVPSGGSATVQRLLAPSAAATSGVTLAGRRLGADGRWHGPLVAPALGAGPSGYTVGVPARSAALVTVTGGRRPRAAGSAPPAV